MAAKALYTSTIIQNNIQSILSKRKVNFLSKSQHDMHLSKFFTYHKNDHHNQTQIPDNLIYRIEIQTIGAVEDKKGTCKTHQRRCQCRVQELRTLQLNKSVLQG